MTFGLPPRLLVLVMISGIPTPLCGQWETVFTVPGKVSLRGIHNTGHQVIWASGTGGTILRGTKNGSKWHRCPTPSGAETLDFRGIWGFDADHAIVMSSGPGEASRLYQTSDGCRSWRLLFTNLDPAGFWDGIRFNGETGVLLGDPVDHRFVIYITTDGGKHWRRENSPTLNADPKGESAFAASNSSLVFQPDGKLLFGTGGVGRPRVFISDVHDTAWKTVSIPLRGGNETAGAFSLAFRDRQHGVAVGGDYKSPNQRDGTAAFTVDGGKTWHTATVPPGGYRSAVDWDRYRKVWIATGPNGSDLSTDDGQTWRTLDHTGWNALSAPWAVGADGRVGRLEKKRPLP